MKQQEINYKKYSKIHSQKRNANMEVLRVLAMFLIVAGHYVWTGVKQVAPPNVLNVNECLMGGVNYASMELLWVIACIGVDCFVMLTGYFMIDKTEMRWGGAIRTWLQTLFYSTGITAITALIFGVPVSSADLLRSILPIHQTTYWFVSQYLALLFLAPFFARLACSLNKRQYEWLLAVLFVFSFTLLYGTVYLKNMHLGFMVFVFFVAGYVRRYGVNVWWQHHAGLVVLALWLGLAIMATVVNVWRWMRGGSTNFELLCTENNGPVFFLALAVFVWFTVQKPWTSRILKSIASMGKYTFGVYLIHQHFLVDKPLWTAVLNTYNIDCPMLIHCLFWAIIVFLACIGIDFIRVRIFHILGIHAFTAKFATHLPIIDSNMPQEQGCGNRK